MALKSVTILLIVVAAAAACFAAPAEEEAPPASENANLDAVVFETETPEHLFPDLDSILEHISQTDAQRVRRAATTEEKVCGDKSGPRATCVPYYLCKAAAANVEKEDEEPECSYIETCCLDSSRVVDLMQFVDIQ